MNWHIIRHALTENRSKSKAPSTLINQAFDSSLIMTTLPFLAWGSTKGYDNWKHWGKVAYSGDEYVYVTFGVLQRWHSFWNVSLPIGSVTTTAQLHAQKLSFVSAPSSWSGVTRQPCKRNWASAGVMRTLTHGNWQHSDVMQSSLTAANRNFVVNERKNSSMVTKNTIDNKSSTVLLTNPVSAR